MMNKSVIGIGKRVAQTGINPLKTIRYLKGIPNYLYDLYKIKKMYRSNDMGREFSFGRLFPCLNDKYDHSGAANSIYFHQDLLVARRIYTNNPKNHIDIGSRVDGFVAHVAAFRPIQVVDIRPQHVNTVNISFIKCDFMVQLPQNMIESAYSLSCLHALEHFGLGRYGDPLNYNGHLSGLNNLYQMLKTDGILYLSVPIGPQRIEFNAHRVFSIKYLLTQFDKKYSIKCFSYINDDGDLYENAQLTEADINNNFNCRYGCGIFEMVKL